MATVVELLGDKVPVVDHALDVLGTVLRPAGAAVATYAVLQGWGTPWAQLFAIGMGAGALAVHGAKAHTRLGSTVVSLGHLNPVVSIVEDAAAFALSAAAVLAPLLALLLVLAGILVIRRFAARIRNPPAEGDARGASGSALDD